MTDNRTTKLLRELLDERGVEYEADDFQDACWTSWNGFTASQYSPNGNLIMAVTPEQAIAATLGSGTLTAEQVSKATYAHSIHADCADADWQAIADELNAELGSGTCCILASSTDGLCSDNPRQWFELSCGHSFTLDGLRAPVACPVCGKAVER